MRLRSLGYRTDLLLARYDGEVADRGRYLSVRTPTNPLFYWGNFLLFDAPPATGDDRRWPSLFAAEIGPPSAVQHVALGWDSPSGDLGELHPFLELGFTLERNAILTARTVHAPPKWNPDVVVRSVSGDEEWDAVLRCGLACRPDEHAEADYRPYKARQVARYRAMVRDGLGEWFAAFLGPELAGHLGVFVERGAGGALARFQSVETLPEYRRRGVCGTLVAAAARQMRERFGVSEFVMAADPDYHAAAIYESVGFARSEWQVGLCRWPRGG